ncbi:hypothetical protein V6N11_030598 [Hibiscus sabdariffa]|uniref:Uncharacterized protein n=1 Tax=Hibiscus sabdariffa TaxID=183260 RepID=A0ABR1ZV08_9ROSI
MGAEIEGNVGVQSDMISNAPFGPEPNINLLNHNPKLNHCKPLNVTVGPSLIDVPIRSQFGSMEMFIGPVHMSVLKVNLLSLENLHIERLDKAEVTNGSSSSYPSSPSGAYPSNRFEAEAVANIAPLVGVT